MVGWGRQLAIAKIKSHSEGIRLYFRSTPLWQMGVNDLADTAADTYSDFVSATSLLQYQRISVNKLLRVCRRLAA